MNLHWEEQCVLRLTAQGQELVISGNPAGLRTLAGFLNTLANEPAGSHIHLDEWNGLEEGSRELILEQIEQ